MSLNDKDTLCNCTHTHTDQEKSEPQKNPKDSQSHKNLKDIKENDSFIFISANSARNKINALITSDYRYQDTLENLVKAINNAIKNGQTRIIFKKHYIELFNTNIHDILTSRGYRVTDSYEYKYKNGPDGPENQEVPVFIIDF